MLALFRLTSVKLLQPENILDPMLVTLPGIVILLRAVQLMNAAYPMLMTPLPIVMLVRLLQRLNI